MLLADNGDVNEDMSADERISREPELPATREVGGRSDGLDASGVLLRFPTMLLAMVSCSLLAAFSILARVLGSTDKQWSK